MPSLFDELNEKIKKDPRLTRRGMPRYDMTLLLFNARDALRELWHSAEQEVVRAHTEGRPSSPALRAAVDRLRPIFGERPSP